MAPPRRKPARPPPPPWNDRHHLVFSRDNENTNVNLRSYFDRHRPIKLPGLDTKEAQIKPTWKLGYEPRKIPEPRLDRQKEREELEMRLLGKATSMPQLKPKPEFD